MPLTVTIVAIVVLVALIVLLILRGSADQTRVLSDVRERLGALAEVTRRLEAMGASVTEVQQLLQVPKLRGTLGEVWLEELLRQILPASHFEMQHAFRSGERVDAVPEVGRPSGRGGREIPARGVPAHARRPRRGCGA
ncbi:MAG TPA: DNA recombination protein RmuC [Gemmatimonadales bacterium]|nr:DNA recombination protein RmuC [Gemmatimonadales bacterium]